jgi:hypothetical protein
MSVIVPEFQTTLPQIRPLEPYRVLATKANLLNHHEAFQSNVVA